MNTIEETLREGQEILRNKCINDADLDGWYLLEAVLKITKAEYLIDKKRKININQYNQYMELIKKRESNIPLGYILGNTEFMGFEFRVNENVLIPRQDTETLVEEVLKVANHKVILDMCTGSGCIIISLMKLTKGSIGTGVDISEEALIVAKDNATSNKVNVEFIRSNLFENIKGKYDIIVSNPPYISKDEIKELMPEVNNHEPKLALYGGEDGLYFYNQITKEAGKYLTPQGKLYFEIGYNQGKAVKEMLKSNGFGNINIVKDLAGLDRVVYATQI